MKNIAKNTMTYLGEITLSQWLGSKKIVIGQTHNSGGKPLFDFLASCFIGDFSAAQAKLPRKIGIYTKDAGNNIHGFCKYPLTTAAKKVDITNSTSSVRYSFSIPFEIISGFDSFEDVYVGLYPENPIDITLPYENYLAEFSLKDLNRSLFLKNSSLVVDWDLQVVNGSLD